MSEREFSEAMIFSVEELRDIFASADEHDVDVRDLIHDAVMERVYQ